jgi:hypothetical protein
MGLRRYGTRLGSVRWLRLAGLTVLIAVALAACGSGAPATAAHGSASPAAAAAQQLARADHSSAETATITADLTALAPDCEETTQTLATDISDAEQDLIRHGIEGNAATVANALVTAVDGLAKSAKPTVCDQLIATYLSSRGG